MTKSISRVKSMPFIFMHPKFPSILAAICGWIDVISYLVITVFGITLKLLSKTRAFGAFPEFDIKQTKLSVSAPGKDMVSVEVRGS